MIDRSSLRRCESVRKMPVLLMAKMLRSAWRGPIRTTLRKSNSRGRRERSRFANALKPGESNSADRPIRRPVTASTRASRRAASKEWPPSSKKSADASTDSIPRISHQICARRVSKSSNGCNRVRSGRSLGT